MLNRSAIYAGDAISHMASRPLGPNQGDLKFKVKFGTSTTARGNEFEGFVTLIANRKGVFLTVVCRLGVGTIKKLWDLVSVL